MALTGNGAYVPEDLEQWASGHETSTEIALAIDALCKTEKRRERLWQDPSPAEEAKIIAAAWRLAGDEDKLFWGSNTIYRSPVSQAAAALGRRGGMAKTGAKISASRANGAKGGRPKKKQNPKT